MKKCAMFVLLAFASVGARLFSHTANLPGALSVTAGDCCQRRLPTYL
jgi:hypothetical protein